IDAIALALFDLHVYIEIKQSKRDGIYGRYPNIAETVIDEVRIASMLDQVLIISFDWSILPIVKSLAPNIETGALISKDVWNPQAAQALERLIQLVTALGCTWMNMDRNLFMDDMPGALH